MKSNLIQIVILLCVFALLLTTLGCRTTKGLKTKDLAKALIYIEEVQEVLTWEDCTKWNVLISIETEKGQLLFNGEGPRFETATKNAIKNYELISN